ncbi:MAG TPA: formyl-CoA transferase [Gammaproteobacteria bacterium]|nr:formyl-CoA transferase [Gammaproteobacteria bacterium]|tara:strand:+ start:96 stop:1316 length:1221 start_codon:yes stop_codon:yes gene_type:complete
MSLPEHILTGYKVLDFTHVLAGPSATRLMVEMGAEVIKVEFPPAGDVSRGLPMIKDGRSGYFLQQNRGKKSICVDGKTDAGREILDGLIAQVDVVMENFAPGAADRLGIGWERVKKINPRAVMCSLSAFGQEGPLSQQPGFDYIAQAYAGVTTMIGEADGPPYFPLLGLGDVNTGVHAACAIGFALLHRERSGKGQYLDISLLDSYYHSHELNVQVYSASNGGIEPTRSGLHHYAVCPLGLFKGVEHYLFIIALEPQWKQVCVAIGRPELCDDERYSTNTKRLDHQEEVNQLIQDWIDTKSSDEEILKALQAQRVPCAPVLSIAETVREPHLRERGTVRTVTDPKFGEVDLPGMPLRFSDYPHNIPLQTAHLGEHNVEILTRMLGYKADKIQELYEASVLHENPAT